MVLDTKSGRPDRYLAQLSQKSIYQLAILKHSVSKWRRRIIDTTIKLAVKIVQPKIKTTTAKVVGVLNKRRAIWALTINPFWRRSWTPNRRITQRNETELYRRYSELRIRFCQWRQSRKSKKRARQKRLFVQLSKTESVRCGISNAITGAWFCSVLSRHCR